jgi:hypothetical protein
MCYHVLPPMHLVFNMCRYAMCHVPYLTAIKHIRMGKGMGRWVSLNLYVGHLGQRQGLTLVHFSAQPEPFLTQNAHCTPPDTPSHPLTSPKHPLNNP